MVFHGGNLGSSSYQGVIEGPTVYEGTGSGLYPVCMLPSHSEANDCRLPVAVSDSLQFSHPVTSLEASVLCLI